MVIGTKKSALGIGMMLVLTTFVGIATHVSAENQPPVADAGGPYTGEECNSIMYDASSSYDPDGNPLTYRWNIEGTWYDASGPYYEWTWLNVFSGTITLEVSDGSLTSTDTADVTVLNVPPIILSTDGPMNVELGTTVPMAVHFFDGLYDPRFIIPSLDTYTATFAWGDGNSTTLSLGVGEFWANASHLYADTGVYHIVITITDCNGGTATTDWYVTVDHNVPQVEAGPDAFIDEGSIFTSEGYVTIVGVGVFTATVDYGDGLGPQPLTLNPDYTFSLDHQYLENAEYTVMVTLFKDGSACASDTALITVANVPPTIISLSASDPVPFGTTCTLSGTFTDPGILDDQTAVIDWGDGGELTTVDFPADSSGTYEINEDHLYANADEYSITLSVTDDDGGSASASVEVTVVASEVLTVDAGPDAVIDEGSSFVSAGSFTDSVEGTFTGVVDYGDGSGPQALPLNPDHTFVLNHQYEENGVYTVLVTIDRDAMINASDSALVTVNNVAPTAMLSNNGPKDEGSSVTVSFTNQYDPGVIDTFTYSFDWENDGTYDIVNQVGASATHTWIDNGVYTVKGMIADDDGGSSEYTTVVTVNNVAPTAVLGNDGPKGEGSSVTVSFNGQYDPGTSDTFTYSFDWNNDGTYEILNQASPSMTHTWYDNGAYTVKGKIQDDDGGFTEYTTMVSVLNVPPTIISLTAPTSPVKLGKSINFTGVFTDPGTYDTHTAVIAWGDGVTTTVNLAAGVYQVNKSHTYGSAGLYVITLTVTDNDGGFDTKSINTTIIIYNPNGGYICGCGGYVSPLGSYPANPNLTGCVCFSFSSKYKCGHTTPEGNTDFRFHFINKRFYSTVYKWLVIVGKKAIYVGEGTINGTGHYGFRITAIDGVGCHQSDKIRMKIWDKDNNNQIVYDTNYGAPDTQDPTVKLSCGYITIYK